MTEEPAQTPKETEESLPELRLPFYGFWPPRRVKATGGGIPVSWDEVPLLARRYMTKPADATD